MSVDVDQNIPHVHPSEPHPVRAVDREAPIDYVVFGGSLAVTAAWARAGAFCGGTGSAAAWGGVRRAVHARTRLLFLAVVAR